MIFVLSSAGGSSITDKVSVPSTTGSAVTGFAVEKSEFPYEELATATNNFSIANKIGEGGYGAVYYAEVRGEVG